MLSKEEIEKATEILKNLHPKIYWQSPDILTYELKPDVKLERAIETLLQYINQLENQIEATEMEHKYDVNMIDEVKGESVKLYKEIRKLEQENNKQSKIIDEMAKEVNAKVLTKEKWCPLLRREKGCYDDDTCLKCIKQYFEKKVEGK